jgi:hypothetical protein
LYAVVFLTGLAGFMGWVDLPHGLQLLQHRRCSRRERLMLFGVLRRQDPRPDSLWDLHTVCASRGGALARAVFGRRPGTWASVRRCSAARWPHQPRGEGDHAARSTPRRAVLERRDVAVGRRPGAGALWLSWRHPLVFFACCGGGRDGGADLVLANSCERAPLCCRPGRTERNRCSRRS